MMSDDGRKRTARRRRTRLAGLILMVWCSGSLGGCAPPTPPGAGAPAAADAAAASPAPAAQRPSREAADGLPAGAVEVGPELYQVPIGADADGCPIYRLYSPTKLVSQAIAYRSPDGGFTADRRAAACPGR
jgi:hypothetical protein